MRITTTLTGRSSEFLWTFLVRRVENICHTRCFANLIFRELVMHQGGLDAPMKRVQMQPARTGNELGRKVPCQGKALWKLTQDVSSVKPAVALVNDLSEFWCQGEFHTITMDCTLKIALAALGQATRVDDTLQLSQKANISDEFWSCTRQTHDPEKNSREITGVISQLTTKHQREQVQFVGSDKSTRKMFNDFAIFINLRCPYLNTVHMGMRHETASFARHRNPVELHGGEACAHAQQNLMCMPTTPCFQVLRHTCTM